MLITPCCCGGSGTNCGQSCSACGGVHLTGGTVTDDNGTWTLNYGVGGAVYWTANAHGPMVQTRCGGGTVDHTYSYQVQCSGDQIQVWRFFSYYLNEGVCIDQCYEDIPGDCHAYSYLAFTPSDCTGKTIDLTGDLVVTSPSGLSSFGTPWHDPVAASTTISLDISQPGTGPCNCESKCPFTCGGFHISAPNYLSTNGPVCTVDQTITNQSSNTMTWIVYAADGVTDSGFRIILGCATNGGMIAQLGCIQGGQFYQVYRNDVNAYAVTCNGSSVSVVFPGTGWYSSRSVS